MNNVRNMYSPWPLFQHFPSPSLTTGIPLVKYLPLCFLFFYLLILLTIHSISWSFLLFSYLQLPRLHCKIYSLGLLRRGSSTENSLLDFLCSFDQCIYRPHSWSGFLLVLCVGDSNPYSDRINSSSLTPYQSLVTFHPLLFLF